MKKKALRVYAISVILIIIALNKKNYTIVLIAVLALLIMLLYIIFYKKVKMITAYREKDALINLLRQLKKHHS
ncbi:hypothetical protein SAMN02927937_01680 [Paenimyroides aquimaris]|uniref:Uncharacterized protein n=1 Tax=Paenimyroides marinum TaxID=1159016 RepID=A0A1H6L4Y6_9FLAO|nr:hypothetical protein [Paenimyroides aquimaris]SEH83356.1 hypothetical protein SAMN02927937_01680 [Paenimyroides aquimaris]